MFPPGAPARPPRVSAGPVATVVLRSPRTCDIAVTRHATAEFPFLPLYGRRPSFLAGLFLGYQYHPGGGACPPLFYPYSETARHRRRKEREPARTALPKAASASYLPPPASSPVHDILSPLRRRQPPLAWQWRLPQPRHGRWGQRGCRRRHIRPARHVLQRRQYQPRGGGGGRNYRPSASRGGRGGRGRHSRRSSGRSCNAATITAADRLWPHRLRR